MQRLVFRYCNINLLFELSSTRYILSLVVSYANRNSNGFVLISMNMYNYRYLNSYNLKITYEDMQCADMQCALILESKCINNMHWLYKWHIPYKR